MVSAAIVGTAERHDDLVALSQNDGARAGIRVGEIIAVAVLQREAELGRRDDFPARRNGLAGKSRTRGLPHQPHFVERNIKAGQQGHGVRLESLRRPDPIVRG